MISFRFHCECGEELEVCETEKWGNRQEPIYKYTFSLCRRCKDEGYDEGYSCGRDEGYIDGMDEGYRKGSDDGYKDGFNDGIEGGKENDVRSNIAS